MTCVVDGVWIYATSSVWGNKQMAEGKAWHGFKNINGWVMTLSVVNVLVKALACAVLGIVYKGSRPSA